MVYIKEAIELEFQKKYTENINQIKRFSASMPHLIREHFNVTHVHNIFSFNHWLQMIRKPYIELIVFYKGLDASGESKK